MWLYPHLLNLSSLQAILLDVPTYVRSSVKEGMVPPLHSISSIISIMYRVLTTVLFHYGGHGVQKLFLDFDDTTSDAYPVLSTVQQDREFAEDSGPRYRHV
jgi:hypothetical protein